MGIMGVMAVLLKWGGCHNQTGQIWTPRIVDTWLCGVEGLSGVPCGFVSCK